MKIAYFDCFSGISGNMVLGALIHAGVDADRLRGELTRLNLDGYRLEVTPANKHGIAATLVDVHVSESDVHRHLPDIEAIIDGSSLDVAIKDRARAVFRRLAEAEARVHGTTPDHIHFHEVGGMDAIIDIVGSVVALDLLGVEAVESSPIPTGRGWVHAAHGRLPVPAPATAELLQGVPLLASDVEYELTTPTGAAIVTTVARRFGSPPPFTLRSIGYGAGHRDLDQPNVLRVLIGETEDATAADYQTDTVVAIETNIDDMNPEFFDHVMDRLLAAGAVDVYLTPIQMKRNRPATTLTALAPTQVVDIVTEIILTETTSLGVRMHETRRRKLVRTEHLVELPEGTVRVKVALLNGQVRNVAPEYLDCRRVAEQSGLPLKIVYDRAKAAALRVAE